MFVVVCRLFHMSVVAYKVILGNLARYEVRRTALRAPSRLQEPRQRVRGSL